MQHRDGVQFVLYQDCLIRIPDPALTPKRGTFFLARNLPWRTGDRALDLGTGAGLIAVVAARRGHQVVATDIVPACCECARANAMLNGVAHLVDVRVGDLFAPVGEEQFDLIATNPSQMPTPPEYQWDDAQARADNGGPDGWQLLDRVILEAPARLRPGGRLVFTLFAFLGVARALDRLKQAGLRPAILTREEQPFPRIGRERLAYLRSLDTASVLPPGCPPTCERLVLCGEKG